MTACGLDAAGENQKTEMRNAFYAGAAVLWEVLMNHAGDHRVMEGIQAELAAFGKELDARCLNAAAVGDPAQNWPQVADLQALSEDQRIDLIGTRVQEGNVVGFMLEKSDPLKIERYIRKLTTRYPGTRVISKGNGPTKGVVLIKVGPATNG